MKYLFCSLAAFGLFYGVAAAQVPTKGGTGSAKTTADRSPIIEMEGTFQSRRGVMDPISCHGYNIGFFNTADGDRMVVCFDRLPKGDDLKIDCDNLVWVQGYYELHTVKSDGGPCRDSDLSVFYVEKWHCQ